ncbi:MAG: hypothetical protein VX546_07980 [Myxococcota bacterium]|nr:hypothetical protein [Myxococcota bacterium]
MDTGHEGTSAWGGVLAGLLVFAALLASFPEKLWHWDEFQLAYGVTDFDLTRHEPHPPGYYLFIVLGRTLAPFAGDPALALRWVSAASIALFAGLAAGPASPALGFGARAGIAAAAVAFALASPLTTRLGVAALSYAAEGVAWLAWLLLLARHAGNGRGVVLGFAGGLAGGIRPTLALWAAFLLLVRQFGRNRAGAQTFAAMAAAGAVGVGLWLVPLLWESGGLTAYLDATGALASGNVWAKSVFVTGFGVGATRLAAMLSDLVTSLGLVAPAFLALIAWRLRGGGGPALARLDPLLHGAALAFAFYALVIYDTPGYLAAVVLPLAAWCLRATSFWLAGLAGRRQAAGATGAVLLAGAGAVLPGGSVDPGYALHDRLLETRFAAVRENFDPSDTLLVTSREYWDYALRHVAHDLPRFTTLQLARDPYFAMTSASKPLLAARERRLQAVGPEPLDLAGLVPDGTLRRVVYMVPFDAADFVAPACGKLTRGWETSLGETLPVLELRAGWRLVARGGRLYCIAP